MQNFKTLTLATQFYELVEQLPLPNHLRDQMLRAASSIALNLAEGNGRHSFRGKRRIYQIAMGSFRECQAILTLAKVTDRSILELANHLGACLYKLSTFRSASEK